MKQIIALVFFDKKINSLGSINPEHADDEISVSKKVNCIISKNPKHPDVDSSVNKK